MSPELPLVSLQSAEFFPATYKVLKSNARLESATLYNSSKAPQLRNGLTAVLRRGWTSQIRQVPCGLRPRSAKQRVGMQVGLGLHGPLKLNTDTEGRLYFGMLLTNLLRLVPLQLGWGQWAE